MNTEEETPGSDHTDEAAEQSPPQNAASAVRSAVGWIEENPTLALVGAFALGVFVGVLLRD